MHATMLAVVLSFGPGSTPMVPPILVYFRGDWDVHWGYGDLTHSLLGWTICQLRSSWVRSRQLLLDGF